LVDVKDVRLSHLRALERPDAANKRFVLSQQGGEAFLGMADKLHESIVEAGEYTVNFNRNGIAYCNLKFYSYFSSEAASILPMVGKPAKHYNNKASREILGIEYSRTCKEILYETAVSQIKLGQVPSAVKRT